MFKVHCSSAARSCIRARAATVTSLLDVTIGASTLKCALGVAVVLSQINSIGYKCQTGLSKYDLPVRNLAPLTTPSLAVINSSTTPNILQPSILLLSLDDDHIPFSNSCLVTLVLHVVLLTKSSQVHYGPPPSQ